VVTDHSSRRPPVKTGDFVDDRYRIIKTLGVGSTGAVFLAEEIAGRRRVALRILRSELAQDPEVLDGFMTEARESAAIQRLVIAHAAWEWLAG